MKKLTIICKENILFGSIVSALAELPDSLANSLTSDYKVNIITLHSSRGSIVKNLGLVRRHSKNVYKSTLSKVEYYLIDESNWMQEIAPLLNQIQPDIIHNFAEPEIVKLIDFTPSKKVYTLSRWDFGFNESSSELYDCVTTIRKNDKQYPQLRTALLTQVFSPNKGFLISTSYSSRNFHGKNVCKQKLLDTYGLPHDTAVFFAGGLVQDGRLDEVVEAIPEFQKNNALLIFINRIEEKKDEALKLYKPKNGLLYFEKAPSIAQLPQLIAASDFYVHPAESELGTLMPLIANSYGAIPILPMEEHLKEHFNDGNSLFAQNGFGEALKGAKGLYDNSQDFLAKRKACMESVVSWDDVKDFYINLYE